MKLRLTRGLCAVALLVVSALLLVVSTEDTVLGHGGQHQLVLNSPHKLAHWSDGGFEYALDSSIPPRWPGYIRSAGTHLKNNTFIEKVDHNTTHTTNIVAVGEWDDTVAFYADCDRPGWNTLPRDTEACVWASKPGGSLDDGVYYGSPKDNLTRIKVHFDPADV